MPHIMLKAHMIEVLVMAPAHNHILDATAFFVDAQLAVVPAHSKECGEPIMFWGHLPGILGIRVVFEALLSKHN